MPTVKVLPWTRREKVKEYEVTDEQYEDIKNILHHARELYRLGLKCGFAQYDEGLTDQDPEEYEPEYRITRLLDVGGELGTGFNSYFLERFVDRIEL